MRSVEFGTDALADFAWWIEQDRKGALRIIRLLGEVQRTPFKGRGSRSR